MADEVLIPVYLLETMKETATSAYYFSHVQDLSDSYRKMAASPKSSKMTVGLDQMVTMLTSFIEIAQEGEPDGSGSDSDGS